MDINECHVHLLFLVDDLNLRVLVFSPNPLIKLLDVRNKLRNNLLKVLKRPCLKSLCKDCMVCVSQEEKARKVRMALETFGLAGREDTLVSKLSGGQKKRLSICTEFVASPNLFILDEPDSGLDGIMARGLMENLRLIACQGKMVLVITHAPDRVAHLFDKVIVLAKGTETKVGQLAFYGGIQEAKDFFGTDSLENVVKRINAVNEGGEGRADEFIEKYKA